jgi:hypothetical protein
MEFGSKMRNRLSSTPGAVSFRSPQLEIPQLQLFASAALNGGMNSQADPVDITENQVVLAQNATCRYDVLSRRTGHTRFLPAAINTKPVLAIKSFKQFDDQVKLLRFTRDTIHIHSTLAWIPIVPAVGLTATDNNRISFLSVNNNPYFGNEVDPLQLVNIAGATCAAAGNAPAYKYYCAFGNRIVGANRVGARLEVGWSGDFNFSQWNPLTDPSAGSVPLIDNPSDYADFITGLFSFSDQMIVMRERSILAATLQPVASNPFYFSIVAPAIGCDTPSSIAQTPSGLAWYDRRLNNVFIYAAGTTSPAPIGDAIRSFLAHDIPDVARVVSAYDPVNNEYRIGAVVPWTSISKVWRYNFGTQAWTYDYIDKLASLSALDFRTSTAVIDDLSGTIDSLVGFIDDITPPVIEPAIFVGMTTGEIMKSSPQVISDSSDASRVYEFQVDSKVFKLNPNDAFVTQLHLEYIPRLGPGSFQVFYTKDGGTTWKLYKNVSWPVEAQDKRLTIVCNKNVRSRTYQWRVYSVDGVFDLVEYSAYAYTSDAYTRNKSI